MGISFAKTPSLLEHGWILLLVIVAIGRGLLYVALVPPWQAPDETGHFEHAWLIARLGRIPGPQDANPELEQALVASLYEWRYGYYIGRPLPQWMPDRLKDLPPEIFAARSRTLGEFSLAYFWIALWLLPLRYEDLLIGLYLARFSSVVLNAAILVVAWKLFHLLLPEQSALARAMTLVLAFHPQHTFINSMVGNGPLAELGALLAIYGWTRILLEGWRGSALAIALGGTGLGVMAKSTALFLLPLAPVAMLLSLLHTFRQSRVRATLGLIFGSAFLALLVSWILYMPGASELDMFLGAWRSGNWAANESSTLPSFDQILRVGVESYWFKLGWMNVSAPPWWYLISWIGMLWALEGWLLPRSLGLRTPGRAIALMTAAVALAVGGWVSFIATSKGAAYYQGRYLFPIAAPFTFLLVGGWARALPESARAAFPTAVVAIVAAFEAIAFFPVVFYTYHGR
ncbi:MAG: hypothetical protein RMK32_02860 [Anaerolineae bacterium]|nr:hypothetical protein [Anaerolineae bacterium]